MLVLILPGNTCSLHVSAVDKVKSTILLPKDKILPACWTFNVIGSTGSWRSKPKQLWRLSLVNFFSSPSVKVCSSPVWQHSLQKRGKQYSGKNLKSLDQRLDLTRHFCRLELRWIQGLPYHTHCRRLSEPRPHPQCSCQSNTWDFWKPLDPLGHYSWYLDPKTGQ